MLQRLVCTFHSTPRILGVAAQQSRQYGDKGSLHLTMEPHTVDPHIFQISLTRPDARNAIGTCSALTMQLHLHVNIFTG